MSADLKPCTAEHPCAICSGGGEMCDEAKVDGDCRLCGGDKIVMNGDVDEPCPTCCPYDEEDPYR